MLFFLGLILIWITIIVLSFCLARCGYLQSTEKSRHCCENMDEQIITKRAVSTLGVAEASSVADVEAGCDTCHTDAPECSICLTVFQEKDIVSWSHNKDCRHAFHHMCILPWLTKDPQCPCCRQPFYGVSSNRADGSFFSVELGLIDIGKATPDQKHLFQPFVKSSELTSHSLHNEKHGL